MVSEPWISWNEASIQPKIICWFFLKILLTEPRFMHAISSLNNNWIDSHLIMILLISWVESFIFFLFPLFVFSFHVLSVPYRYPLNFRPFVCITLPLINHPSNFLSWILHFFLSPLFLFSFHILSVPYRYPLSFRPFVCIMLTFLSDFFTISYFKIPMIWSHITVESFTQQFHYHCN